MSPRLFPALFSSGPSLSSSLGLLPAEDDPRPIPRGTKVRFRWKQAEVVVPNASGLPSPSSSPSSSSISPNPSIVDFYGGGRSPSPASSAETMPADQLQWMDSQLVALRSRTTPLDHSPPSSSGAGLLSAGLLLLFSLAGLLLLFILLFCLFRMFKREERGDGPRHRELQIVLVPKQRPLNRRPSLVHPGGDGNGQQPQQKQQQQQLIPPSGQQKPFPRRIYEIQAEEGYFSCAPSMRASFEID